MIDPLARDWHLMRWAESALLIRHRRDAHCAWLHVMALRYQLPSDLMVRRKGIDSPAPIR